MKNETEESLPQIILKIFVAGFVEGTLGLIGYRLSVPTSEGDFANAIMSSFCTAMRPLETASRHGYCTIGRIVVALIVLIVFAWGLYKTIDKLPDRRISTIIYVLGILFGFYLFWNIHI